MLAIIIVVCQVIDPRNIKMLVLDEADVMIDLQGQQNHALRIQK